jgi:TadE-like protein
MGLLRMIGVRKSRKRMLTRDAVRWSSTDILPWKGRVARLRRAGWGEPKPARLGLTPLPRAKRRADPGPALGSRTDLLHDIRGSALVEGAVLLPLLCILVFGVYEFSWFFYQQHVASTGIRDAARYLSRVIDPCRNSSTAWVTAEGYAKNLATTGSITGGPPRIRGWGPSMVTLRCTTIENPVEVDGLQAYRGPRSIHVVTVSTRFTDPSLGFFRILGLQPPLISVSHSERAIGPG